MLCSLSSTLRTLFGVAVVERYVEGLLEDRGHVPAGIRNTQHVCESLELRLELPRPGKAKVEDFWLGGLEPARG
jgi:hypothetical protein